MTYSEFQPSPHLKPFVSCYWILEDKPFSTPSIEKDKVLPDGCPEMIFHYGDQFKKYNHDNKSDLQPRAFIYGQITRHIELEPTGRTGVFGVRFTPDGLGQLLNIPMNLISETYYSINDILGKETKDLINRIIEATTTLNRIALVEQLLSFYFNRINKIDHLIHESVDYIKESHGNIKPGAMAKKLDISERQLERRFKTSVGVSPKALSGIYRFQKSLTEMNAVDSPDLTRVAYKCGYFDQSHFIKDFTKYSGVSPTRFLNQSGDLTNSFL